MYKKVSIKVSKFFSFTLVFSGFLIALIPVLKRNYQIYYFKTVNTKLIPGGFYSFTFLSILFIIPLISSVVINIISQFYLKKKFKAACTTGNILTTAQVLRKKRFKKITCSLKILRLSYFFCISPIFLLTTLRYSINWNLQSGEKVFIPTQIFLRIYNITFSLCFILMSFNTSVQMFINSRNDDDIKFELNKLKDKIKNRCTLFKTTLSSFPNNVLSFLIRFIRIIARFLSRCFRIFNRNNEEVVIAVIPQPRVAQNPGRANVYNETDF